MKTEQKQCNNCNSITNHKLLGFVPMGVIRGRSDRPEWINAAICTNCGTVTAIPPTEDQLERSENRYVKELVDHRVITEEEAKEILGY